MRDWFIAIVGGIAAAIANWVISRFVEYKTMKYVWDFLATFMPLWMGLVALLLIRSILFIYRLQTRHDALFDPWFRHQESEISREMNTLRHTVMTELEATSSRNNAGFDTFCAQYDHRLFAVEEAIKGLKSRGGHSDEPSS